MNAILLFMPSGPELIIIVVIILLLFGGKKIPELMRGLGKGVKEFKNASEGLGDVKNEIEKTSSVTEEKPKKYERTGDEEKLNRDEDKKDGLN